MIFPAPLCGLGEQSAAGFAPYADNGWKSSRAAAATTRWLSQLASPTLNPRKQGESRIYPVAEATATPSPRPQRRVPFGGCLGHPKRLHGRYAIRARTRSESGVGWVPSQPTNGSHYCPHWTFKMCQHLERTAAEGSTPPSVCTFTDCQDAYGHLGSKGKWGHPAKVNLARRGSDISLSGQRLR